MNGAIYINLASRVKIADLHDNIQDVEHLPPAERTIKKRYAKALAILLNED